MGEAPLTASRRELLGGAVAAALVLGVDFSTARVAAAAEVHADHFPFAPDAFIRIASDGEATLIMPQVEMGQGIYTGLTMLIAEEMDLAMDRVRLEAAPASDALYGNPIFKIQATGGSTSMRAYWTPLRRAGAAARAMLVAAAARLWRVEPASLRTEAGEVIHQVSSRRAGYGALAALAARQEVPTEIRLKAPSEFRLIGKSQRRLDTPDKVNGTTRYGIDAMPPGVRFAALAVAPVPGGRLVRVDAATARAVPGVEEVLLFDDMIACVATNSWAAIKAVAALEPEWDDGAFASLSSTSLRVGLEKAARGPAVVVKDEGRAAQILEDEDGRVDLAFRFPLLAHAPMEPMNCTVHVKDGGCEIWVGTQVMTMTQRAAAEVLAIAPERVEVHNHLLGGGFGRRLETDFVVRAVRVAQRCPGPVKTFYSRELDIRNSMYRSIYGTWLSARIEDGKPVAWRHRIVGPAIIARWLPPGFDGRIDSDAIDGAEETPYDFPNFRVEYVRHELPAIPTAFWRGVGPNVNVFSVEVMIDAVAEAAGRDPLEFRRDLIKSHPRARAVLDLAAKHAGWGGPLGASDGRTGRGISLQYVFGSYLATVAEIVVDDAGKVAVRRLVTAVDCGTLVNPDQVRAQIEGGLIFGMTAALHGEVTVAGGRIEQGNFHDYRMVRIDEAPLIEVHLVESAAEPGGIGEPGTVSVQPAIANAIHAATGHRIVALPVDPAQLARSRS